MVCSAQRVLMFLILFGLLAVQPDKVSGLTTIDLVFRHSREENRIATRNQRILKAVDMKGMSTEKKPAAVPVNNTFDPNQSSKRRVRRGSDPIHNRS
ncbi:Clavata3/esr-related 45, putative [Theobroma cacao]|uniref:Clavata3/esr-related 45, putative n=1 Tax=Theobroma cacao TaxID=3641 RepID=A0A061EBA2_THECC|nr:Clavata3/esr-related 45, putative [Theobroma cacao]